MKLIRVLPPSWFISYAFKLVLVFYSAIQHGIRCFISILRRQDRVCLYNALRKICFRKLIFKGCCLVTRAVKVTSTDLELGLKSAITAIFKEIKKYVWVTVVHRLIKNSLEFWCVWFNRTGRRPKRLTISMRATHRC